MSYERFIGISSYAEFQSEGNAVKFELTKEDIEIITWKQEHTLSEIYQKLSFTGVFRIIICKVFPQIFFSLTCFHTPTD
jgi:hypothetical protein